MTIEEIFSTLYSHMNKGIKIHNKIAEAFAFLNLYGYKKCHEYHYYEENYNCICLRNFYLKNYCKLLPEKAFEDMEIYPITWYKYFKQDVDMKTKRESIQMLIKKWIVWEQEAKELFELSYKQLQELKEFYAADIVNKFIIDTGNELIEAKEKLINLETINYDLPTIIMEQDSLCKLYKKKIKKIYEDDNNDQNN